MARRSVNADTFWHLNPIPGASQIGPLLKSGFVPSLTPGERSVPASFDEQMTNVFIHIVALLDAAGGTLDDVVEINFMVAPGIERSACNDAFVAHFPDDESRPARSVSTHANFPLDSIVAATFTAYIES